MLHRVFRKAYDYVCQKIVETNQNVVAKGFMEINPQYYNDMMVQSNMVDYWINQLESQIAQVKVKEQLHKQGIARCNYLIQEVLPLIGTSMALLKQSVDYNSRVQKHVVTTESKKFPNKQADSERSTDLIHFSHDEKVHFQNITLMLSDTFERLGEKRNKLNQWVTQAQLECNTMPEA